MSLRVRLIAAFAYVLVLVIVALEVPLALNLSRRVDAEIKSEAQGQAQILASSASGLLEDSDDLQDVAEEAADELRGRVIMVDARGTLLADSAGEGLLGTSYASRPEIAAALRSTVEQGTRHSDDLGEDILYTAVPVVRRGRTVGAVRVTQSVEAVQAEVRKDVLALIAVGVVALGLGLGVAWLLAGSLARPLRRLAATARQVEEGDLDARAPPEGSSEQREVAASFNDMTARLAEALRAQQEFVANASHQLRTPLTGLRLRLESAALKADDPSVVRDLEAAEHEAERMARLLGELLTLARERERPPAERLDLAKVVASAAERWEGPARATGHRLITRGRGAATVAASAADLAIVLDNLIENALNYAPAGSGVLLEWGTGLDHALLAVLDEGPGLDPAERPRLFERFYRGGAARRSGAPGSGLGLALVEALAQRWGGRALLSNRPEGGTRAEVRLPLSPGPPAAEPVPNRHLDEALPERG